LAGKKRKNRITVKLLTSSLAEPEMLVKLTNELQLVDGSNCIEHWSI